jgi:methionyl-tRNA synthetase
MNQITYNTLAQYIHVSPTVLTLIFVVMMLWSLAWKGLALWKSARKDKVWFIIFLFVNTLGLLEILYIYVLSSKSEEVISSQV